MTESDMAGVMAMWKPQLLSAAFDQLPETLELMDDPVAAAEPVEEKDAWPHLLSDKEDEDEDEAD